MYHYLFTNDLRISSLQSALTKAGDCFVTNTVPSASEDKSENNNMKTLGFYFNLTTTSNCAKECQNGNVRKVVLNFIKKFQFPNPRTQESLVDAFTDGITIAPMRLVLQVLYNMHILYPGAAHLTRDEILNFFFYNSTVAKNKNPNIVELVQQIIEYRKTSTFPSTVERDPDKRNWKHEDRQIREMVKLLLYSGCISENERQELYIKHDDLTVDNKAALFDILTYTRFWMPDSKQNYNVNRSSYENYMDVECLTDDDNDDLCDVVFAHNIYGIHIKLQNDALSDTNPHICIGWSKIGDMSDITTKEELGSRYEAAYPNEKKMKKAQDLGQIWRFIKEMQISDYVVFSNGDTCHIGRIASDYYYDNAQNANQDSDYVNIREVEWLKKDIRKSDLSEVFQNSLGAAMSVFRLNDYKSAVNDLLNDTYIKDELLLEEIEEEDIFSGFEPWLTSYNNPDYTGKQKYEGYAKALVRLVKFMCDNNLIEDNDLNDKNLEKYISWVEIYNSSNEAKEYDNKASKTGSAALSKYVKYIKYIVTPHAVDFDYSTTNGQAINKIFYGVPGCGKSHHVQYNILKKENYEDKNIVRTTFYQDYSNTDFVGQILPKIVKGDNGETDSVEYIFNPGPFTLAFIKAISNPTEKVALVIEEINRGNAPAIFGDMFQLLDRNKDGVSEYGIVNVSMMDYLNDYDFVVDGEKKRYIFKEIKIPGNMYIYATMNTSDQNVYTLDTAFVRRWDRERIKNSFDECTFKSLTVPGMKPYTWQEFVDGINKHIAKHIEDLQVNEDKQLGVYFVRESLLVNGTAEAFAHKVFDYLWSDVAKLDHDIFFNHYDTLEDLIIAYVKDGVKVFKSGIFGEKEIIQEQEEKNNE